MFVICMEQTCDVVALSVATHGIGPFRSQVYVTHIYQIVMFDISSTVEIMCLLDK